MTATAIAPAMAHLPALVLHILGGIAGILTGWGAILAAKGKPTHRLFGKAFVAGMALMGAAAIWLASQLTARKPMEQANVVVAVLVLYLISTSWMTVRRAPNTTGMFDKFALAIVTVAAATMLLWGVRALGPHGYDGYGPAIYFAFGGVAALFAASEASSIYKGGVEGSARIARHLSRMCAAWFIACTSFFLGQQKVMPAALHGSLMLDALAFAPLGFLLFWFVRVRIARQIVWTHFATGFRETGHEHRRFNRL